jgi:hypothetical protein
MAFSSFGPPPMPRWLLFLRIATLVTSAGVLAAAAYNISLYAGLIVSATPAGFLVFNAVFNILIVGSMLACEFWLKRFYSRLAFSLLLGVDGVLWLGGWAWAARWAGRWLGFDHDGASGEYDAFAGSITAGAALGAITWLVSLLPLLSLPLSFLPPAMGGQLANQFTSKGS